MSKRVFVTGATGFVGSHLVPFLAKRGYQVTALVRTQKEKKGITRNVKIIVGDLSRKGGWQNYLKNHDVLIHLAATVSSKTPAVFKRDNVVATKNLISTTKATKIKKIILFSSAAVTSIRRDWYAQTKAQQEEVIKKSKINHVILRLSMIYGPGDTKNIGWLISILKKLPAVPLPGGGKFGRQPVFIDDICRIVLKLIEKNYKQKIFEIHGYEYISVAKIVKVILKSLRKFKLVFPVPLFFLTIPFWIGEKIFSNPKFTSDQIKSLISGERFSGDKWWDTFDIIPTRFEAGIEKMIRRK